MRLLCRSTPRNDSKCFVIGCAKHERRTTKNSIMEYLLYLNASAEYLNMGIGNKDEILYQISGKTIYHSQFIQKYFKNLLELSKIENKQIKEIILCTGPGSFTGLRVGTAFAYGLSNSLEIPVFGINKFSILVNKLDFIEGNIICIINLNREQVIMKGYRCKERKCKVILRQTRIRKNEFVAKIKSIKKRRCYFCGEIYKSELKILIKNNFKNSIIIPDNASQINLSDLLTYKSLAKKL